MEHIVRRKRKRSATVGDTVGFSRPAPLAILLHAVLTFFAVVQRNAIPAQAQGDITVGSFIDGDTLDRCKTALNEADTDNDLMVTADEYITYIRGESGQAIETEADELVEIPLSLVMLFIRYACQCVQRPGATPLCCHGENAHLNIVDDGSTTQALFFQDFCLDARDAIEEVAVTASPTQAPTVAPTFENQMSVRFQYTLTNEDGLDAEAVMTGAGGNTLKADLEAATRTIVIRTLNETNSDAFRGRNNVNYAIGSALYATQGRNPDTVRKSIFDRVRQNKHERQQQVHSDVEPDDKGDGAADRRLFDYDASMQLYLEDGAGTFLQKCGIDIDHLRDNTLEERAVALALAELFHRAKEAKRGNHQAQRHEGQEQNQQNGHQNNQRQLAIFTDLLPIDVYLVLDDPTCPQKSSVESLIQCLVIFTRIHLLLEEGDDQETVRQLVSEGMRNSFADGSFIAAIPDRRRLDRSLTSDATIQVR